MRQSKNKKAEAPEESYDEEEVEEKDEDEEEDYSSSDSRDHSRNNGGTRSRGNLMKAKNGGVKNKFSQPVSGSK